MVVHPSLDLQLELDDDERELAAPAIVRVRSKSCVKTSDGPKSPRFSLNCCVTPRDTKKRRSLSVIIDRSRRLNAGQQQHSRTVISIDLSLLRLLLVLACCLSSARGLVVPTATRPAFEARRLALASNSRSRLPLADVALYPAPRPLGVVPTLLRLGAIATEAASTTRLELTRATLSQQYRAQHALSEQPPALVAPLNSLSGMVCGAMFPVRHRAICKWHAERAEQGEAELARAKAQLSEALERSLGPEEAARVLLKSRVKSSNSIFEKAVLRKKQVKDLLGVRVIVDNDGAAGEAQCYNVAQSLRALWPDDEIQFKDYIALPKSNGYQSLHALVTTRAGIQIEFQIRTAEMQQLAEGGSAAHALYKAAGGLVGEQNALRPSLQI